MADALTLHRDVVRPEWTDYNGHMSEAYYVLVFGNATDAFYDHIDLDAAFRAANRLSVYTVEAHIRYLTEAHRGERLLIRTQIIDVDAKRMHLWHAMVREDDGAALATTELMLLHVDTTARRAVPFLPATVRRLAAVAASQAALPRPDAIGRFISISRPPGGASVKLVRRFLQTDRLLHEPGGSTVRPSASSG